MKPKPKNALELDGPNLHISRRDNNSLQVVWEMTDQVKLAIEEWFRIPLNELPFVLRLYDVTEREVFRDGQDQYVDFHIAHQPSEWTLYGLEDERSYCVELGIRMIDGRYYSLKQSNRID